MGWQQEFGEQIRKARESKGMSQEELADGLSVSRPTLSNYENGKNAISAKVAAEIASKLDKGLSLDGCEITRKKTKPLVNENQLCLDFDKEYKFGPITIKPTRKDITVTTTIVVVNL